jgi:hypothetical protein
VGIVILRVRKSGPGSTYRGGSVSERFYVEGGKRLQGKVEVSGAKNAALKFVAAALLAPGKTVLHDVPRIKDMHTMLALLDELGVRTTFSGSTLEIDASTVDSYTAPYELVRQMRASLVVLGPLASARPRYPRQAGAIWVSGSSTSTSTASGRSAQISSSTTAS